MPFTDARTVILVAATLATSMATCLVTFQAVAAPDKNSSGLAAAYLSAQHADAVSDATKASTYIDRALKIDAENTALLRMSYILHASSGDIPAAAVAAKQFLDSGAEGTKSPAQIILAVDLFKRQQYDQAWEMIGKVSGQGFIAAALPVLRAWIRAPKATFDEAVAELAPMKPAENARDSYELMVGLLNEFYGRDAGALAIYQDLGERIDKLPLTSVSFLAGGYHRLGKSADLKALLDKYRAARVRSRDMATFVESFADPRMATKKITADAGLAEALFLTSQAMLANSTNPVFVQSAVVYGRAALYLNPTHGMARWIIGDAASRTGSIETANAILGSIKPSEPTYLAAQLQIAENLERRGRKADAMTQLQTLARQSSDAYEPHLALANLLRSDNKFEAAVEAYDKAFALLPDDQKDNWVLYYTRGIALERSKNWKRAEADFKRALEISPEEPWVLNYLGYSWLDRGENVIEARALIERAYKKRPDDGAIVDSLGWAMYLNGEYESAVVQLEKAAEINPADSTINSHLGDAYWKVGRRNEARFQWRRALSLSTEEPEKTALRGKLDQGLAQN